MEKTASIALVLVSERIALQAGCSDMFTAPAGFDDRDRTSALTQLEVKEKNTWIAAEGLLARSAQGVAVGVAVPCTSTGMTSNPSTLASSSV